MRGGAENGKRRCAGDGARMRRADEHRRGEDRHGEGRAAGVRRGRVRAIRCAQQSCEEIAKGQRETTLNMDEVIGRFRQEVYDWRNRVLRGEIPPEYAEHPPALVRAVTLAKIDEGWAAYLREIEDARERCGVVSLVGRDYRVEYIKEVSAMYETMLESVRAEIPACWPA